MGIDEQGNNESVCGEATEGQVERMSFEEQGHGLRARIKAIAYEVKCYIEQARETTPTSDDSFSQNHSEMVANAELSYRHLEDAAMRIGKVLQAHQGGVSILDKLRDKELVDRDVDSEPQGQGATCE